MRSGCVPTWYGWQTPCQAPRNEHITRLLAKLGKLSVSTLERTLKRVRQGMECLAHRRKPPGQSRAILRGIPMTRISRGDPQAGHFEVYLVLHHRGPNPTGQHIFTVQILDVATG